MKLGIVGVLLAAGRGRRFGGDKVMHLMPSGVPMVLASANSLRTACDHVVVVVRSGHTALTEVLTQHDFQWVVCQDADLGMGYSLAAGVKAVPNARGWVVALADMPFIQPSSHTCVVDAIRRSNSLSATCFKGQRGHPVGFAQHWFKSLSELTGDEGARQILSGCESELVLCDVCDDGVVKDVDRPGDFDPFFSKTRA